jgi:ribonuclease D
LGVDTERASGFRYGQDAYLVQVARRGAGTFLIDPVAIDDLGPVVSVINSGEWILHAASQDIFCLRDLGLCPERLVDTELGARLLGFPRVSLGTLSEHYLGIRLEKAHSADDWSERPLPTSWLEYAAFDAAVLPSLWEHVEQDLTAAGKLTWAQEEFEHTRTLEPKPVPAEPWRKLSGIHKLQGTRQLAIARELWTQRDEVARARDLAPGRLIPDRSIVFAAQYQPRSPEDLAAQPQFKGRASRAELMRWWRAIRRGKLTDNLPSPPQREAHSIPHHRTWEKKRPEAAQRLALAKPAVRERAQELEVPVENLLSPDTLRHLAWQPPSPLTHSSLEQELSSLGARQWQIAETQQVIYESFVEAL